MPDIEGSWENDKEKVKEGIREYRQSGSLRPSMSLTAKMEYTFWTGAIISVAAMIIAMFFIDPAVHGRLWLFGSLGAICAFGGLALITRQLPEV